MEPKSDPEIEEGASIDDEPPPPPPEEAALLPGEPTEIKIDNDEINRIRNQARRISQMHDGVMDGLRESGFIDDNGWTHEDEDFDEDGNFLRSSVIIHQDSKSPGVPIKVDYQEPTAEMIRNFVRKRHLRNKKTGKKLSVCTKVAPTLCCGGKNSQVNENLRELGPGVSSYFFFLKLYGWTFLAFGILSIPVMYFNYIVSDELAFFMTFSVGNLFQREDIIDVNDKFEVSAFGQRLELDRLGLSYLNVITDLVIVIIFLSVSEYSYHFFQKEQYKWEKFYPTLENFSVEITNLPKQVSYVEIKNFFENFVLEKLGDIGEVNAKNIVNDVQLVTTTKDKLTYAIKVADLARAAEHKEAKYGLASKRAESGKISAARLNIIFNEYKRSVAKLKKYTEKKNLDTANRKISAVKAFVTFNSLKLRTKVLEAFNKKLSCNLCSKDKSLYLQDKRLKVRPAVSPAFVKWENVDYKKTSQRGRGCLSFLMIAFVLFLSFTTMFVATKVEQVDFFLSPEQQEFVEDLDCNDFFAEIDQDFGVSGTNLDNVLQNSECVDETSLQELGEVCTKAFICFCEVTANDRNSEEILANPVCQDILAVNSILVFATGLLVTFFNFILELMISNSVKFEKSHDRSIEEKNLFTRLFISTYINTALVKLVTDLSFQELFGFEFDEDNAFLIDGDFTDFTFDWYGQVGIDIVMIGFSNIFGPHILSFFDYVYFNAKKCCFKPISVQDIKRRFLGPEFLLPLKYAQAATIIYFTLTYSSGIPFLYPIGAFSLLVAFYVDKFLLLKLHRTPPLYTNNMVLWITKGLRIAILIHLLFAIFMLSEPGLFPVSNGGFDVVSTIDSRQDLFDAVNITNSQPFFTRVSGTPVIFLTLMFVFLAAYLILVQFEVMFRCLTKIIGKIILSFLKAILFILRCLTCFVCCSKTKDADEWGRDLRELKEQREALVLDRERLVGINSYNILANPLYSRRLKLKGDRSFNEILASSHDLHSTEQVLPLLDKGQDRAIIDKIVEREASTRLFFKKRKKYSFDDTI